MSERVKREPSSEAHPVVSCKHGLRGIYGVPNNENKVLISLSNESATGSASWLNLSFKAALLA
jgi:hypothetical protein